MKATNILQSVSSIALGFVLVACSNPADETQDARVSDAVDAVKAVAEAKTYTISPDSKISFVGSKVTGSHDGGFEAFEGTMAVAGGKIVPPSRVTIQMDSLWADNNRLAGHLRNADFFDVPNFPTAEFVVTSMNGPELTGNLTLRGVTKSVTFTPDVDITGSEVSFEAEFDIKRFDWGIAFKGRADDLIRDEVVIKLDVVASADG